MIETIIKLLGLSALLTLLLAATLKLIKQLRLILLELIRLFGDLVHAFKKSFGKRHYR